MIANRAAAAKKAPRTVAQDFKEIGGMAQEMAQEKVGQVMAGAVDCAKNGRASLRSIEHGVAQYIRDQPLMSVLLATGVGMVLGRFWMRR